MRLESHSTIRNYIRSLCGQKKTLKYRAYHLGFFEPELLVPREKYSKNRARLKFTTFFIHTFQPHLFLSLSPFVTFSKRDSYSYRRGSIKLEKRKKSEHSVDFFSFDTETSFGWRLMDVVDIDQRQLGLVVTQLFRSTYTKFVQGRPYFLDHIRVNLIRVISALLLHRLQKSYRQGYVIKSATGSESGAHDFWVGDKIHT